MKRVHRDSPLLVLLVWGLLISGLAGCTAGNGWRALNQKVIEEHNIKGRERDIPHTEVAPSLEAGKTVPSSELPVIRIAEGVQASVAWGEGVLMERLSMEADSSYPEQALAEEVITLVQEGSATCTVGEETFEVAKDSLLYLTPGSKRSLKAGDQGLKAIEVFSPVRLDHLSLAGKEHSENTRVSFPDQGVIPVHRTQQGVQPQRDPVDGPDSAGQGQDLQAQRGPLPIDLGEERHAELDSHGPQFQLPSPHPSRGSVDDHPARFSGAGHSGCPPPR